MSVNDYLFGRYLGIIRVLDVRQKRLALRSDY